MTEQAVAGKIDRPTVTKVIRTPTRVAGGITPDEKTRLDAHAAIWIARAMRTDPIEPGRIVPAIEGLYAAAGLKRPRVVIVPSPLVMAFAYGAASTILANQCDDVTRAATRAATHDATDVATDATHDATLDATDATHAATRAATHDATDDVTRVATRDATHAATRDATHVAIYDATRDATDDATLAATHDATHAATRDATRAATHAATRDATRAATRDATHAVTRATHVAIYDATRDATAATRGATHAAIRDAIYDATHDANHAATFAANRAANRAATAVTRATAAATRAATLGATRDATAAATRDATLAATHDATSDATDATSDATDAATDAATHDATDVATHVATHAATRGATHDAIRDAIYDATHDATFFGSGAAAACVELAGDEGLFRASQWSSVFQGGNLWAPWECYLTAMRDVLGLRLPQYEQYAFWEQCAIEGGGRIMHSEFCMVSDFPEVLKIDDMHRPHCADGPSHRWRDGWSLYHWHGTVVPREWIEDRASLTAAVALKEPNLERRRAAIEMLGWAHILTQLDAREIDHDPDPEIGTLVEVHLPDLERPARFLRVLCGTKREFAIGVPDDVDTALSAQAWIAGLTAKDFQLPEVRT